LSDDKLYGETHKQQCQLIASAYIT